MNAMLQNISKFLMTISIGWDLGEPKISKQNKRESAIFQKKKGHDIHDKSKYHKKKCFKSNTQVQTKLKPWKQQEQ